MIRSLLYLLLRRVRGLVGPNDRMAAEAELEIAVLRHQVTILRRQVKRPVYRKSDRAFLAVSPITCSQQPIHGSGSSAAQG